MYRKENNKLIAEFMGLTKSGTMMTVDGSNMYNSREEEAYIYHGAKYGVDGLRYKYSWDWLMPVVEKIESLVLKEDNFPNVTIGATCYCIIQDSYGEVFEFIGEEESKLKSVYKAVVEFIKWYNEKK